IKEAYLIRSKKSKRLLTFNSKINLLIFICTTDFSYPGVELLFEDVERLCIPFVIDLEPSIHLLKNKINFFCYKFDFYNIYSTAIKYRILDERCWGNKTRYKLIDL